MRVLVIGGGISDEREVALRSSRAVFEAAGKAGYQVEFYDWDGAETWLKQNAHRFDVILPILHGKGGEDGTIQAILEKTEVPYLGSKPEAASRCFDKQQARKVIAELGLQVPKGGVMNYQEYQRSELINVPHVVKPVMGGSSIHTHIIQDISQVETEAIKKTFELYDRLLVEECIIGVEVTAAVLDGKELPLIEIIPPEGQLFDYENKYNGATAELCPPENVSEALQKQAAQMAQKAHQALGCRHFSRTDIMIREDQLYFLETNIIPGLTNQSLFPKAAKVAGLDFPELVDYFIKLTLNRV